MPGGTNGSASFDLSPVAGSMAMPAAPIIVCKYTPGGGSDNPYTVLPNVFCLRIDYREGPEPPVARFQYMTGDLLEAAMGWPSQFEQLWPIDAQGSYVVLNDDRLVVMTQTQPSEADQDPQPLVLFDGFAQIPQADVSAHAQAVTFVAQGVPVRLWDIPIQGRTQRDADGEGTTDGSADVAVSLPCRFNPSDTSIGILGGYIGNCVGADNFTEDPDLGDYPVFIEPLIEERMQDDSSYWFISDAIKYLIALDPSPKDADDKPYVTYPTFDSLDDVLGTYVPPDDELLNSGDATLTNIKIRDFDATNKSVADAMAELLRYAGFVMVFAISTNDDGTPKTSLVMRRRDGLATTAPKVLYLAADGASELDLTANNVSALHLARDCNDVVNQWNVETALNQIEVTVQLAPGFTPASGDDSSANITKWYSSNLTNATDDSRRMYRWWVADECGDGHWNAKDSMFTTGTPIDLTPIFPKDEDTGDYTYVNRYRPGSQTLIAKDSANKPLKAVLQIQKNVTGGDPAIQTQSAASASGWITVPHGWRLLDDRLGIEITAENPNEWHTGAPKQSGSTASIPTIRAVSWTANPSGSGNQPFVLQLTTVIEGDTRGDNTAVKRPASPTQFTRERTADGKDHFQYCEIDVSSIYYSTQKDKDGKSSDGTNPLICRDDTAAAKAHAEQLRSAHEFPILAGSATIPFITDYYQIGDQIKIIQGRDATLQINVGADQGEAPSYPWVTAFAWDFQGDKQHTVLQFSDRRAEPQGV
jgi:hypothetical protein